ncbi:hypothetical protein [Nocardia tengchongensis]|uniref:hypothetical protein n=1 Tax=Nocardia tengchongensis TaxID=2055889 RepID=UPI003649D97C
MSWGWIGPALGGAASSGVGIELIRRLFSRGSDRAQADVNHAVANNQLSDTVAKLSETVGKLHDRIDAAEGELSKYRIAQSRLENLFRHAIEVIRDFMDIARDHDIPAPEMSDELLDEIASRT